MLAQYAICGTLGSLGLTNPLLNCLPSCWVHLSRLSPEGSSSLLSQSASGAVGPIRTVDRPEFPPSGCLLCAPQCTPPTTVPSAKVRER